MKARDLASWIVPILISAAFYLVAIVVLLLLVDYALAPLDLDAKHTFALVVAMFMVAWLVD